MTLKLTSTAFAHQGAIPKIHTCQGQDVSPKELPADTLQGTSDFQRAGYGGPCPPVGRHRYFHGLYALDVVLPDLKKPRKQDVEKAIAIRKTRGMPEFVRHNRPYHA